MQFTVVFTTSVDTDFSMESKTKLDIDKETFTWMDPFKVNGLSADCDLQFDFYIETEYAHRVFVHKVSVPSGRLTYTKRMRKKSGSKRNSIRYLAKSNDQVTHHITIDDTIVNYTAERYKEFIRLNIISICTTTKKIPEIINRTGTRITLDSFKANYVFTMKNNKRYYTWICKKDPVIVSESNDYDCDKNNSKENSLSHISVIELKTIEDSIQLVFTRDVFFPIGPTGLDSKYIRINLKKIDFDAMLNRLAALNVEQEQSQLCLDRAIRHNVLLKVKFKPFVEETEEIQSPRIMLSPRKKKSPRKKVIDRIYTVNSIGLVIDNYQETIEKEFK